MLMKRILYMYFLHSLPPIYNYSDEGGGGGSEGPLDARKPPRFQPRRFTTLFYFWYIVLRIFWHQVCENRTFRWGIIYFWSDFLCPDVNPKMRGEGGVRPTVIWSSRWPRVKKKKNLCNYSILCYNYTFKGPMQCKCMLTCECGQKIIWICAIYFIIIFLLIFFRVVGYIRPQKIFQTKIL